MLQEKLEDDGVASREWSVRIRARVSAHGALVSYILLFILYLQRNVFGSVAGHMFGNLWDLGSIPRSPYNFHIIFP